MTERTIQIQLSNRNAILINQATNEYIFEINELISTQQNHIYVKLLNAVFPYSWYSINEDNNTLSFLLNSNQTLTVIIPVGNYTGRNLASTIQDLVNLNSFTVEFNIVKSKLIFYYSLPLEIQSTTSTVLSILGFDETVNSISTFSVQLNQYVLMSSYPINLGETTHICISLPNIDTNGYILGDNVYSPSLLCSIPVSANPMNNIIYSNDENLTINTERNDLRQFHIKISDQNGKNINFNNIPFSLNLLFEIVRFVE